MYRISNDEGCFRAGTLPDGQQVLYGPMGLGITSVYFKSNGEYSRVERTALPVSGSSPDCIDWCAAMDEWQSKASVSACSIWVHEFFIHESRIGITKLPEYLQEAVSGFLSDDSERAELLRRDAKSWTDRGCYVLWWAEEYYMDADGNVESS